MKRSAYFIGMVVLAGLMAACAGQTGPQAGDTPESTGGEMDYAALAEALETGGAAVEAGEEVEQPFFAVTGRIIRVNGQDVQVFEYEDADAADADAALVAPDGGSVGATMVAWIDAPHFFSAGRIIVLYVGSDADVLTALEAALGPQFAGQ